MGDDWHYAEGGKTVGPLTLAQLGMALRRAPDPRAVLVWQAGMTGWEKAGNVPALAVYMIKPPVPPQSLRAGSGFAFNDGFIDIIRGCMGPKFAEFKGRAPRKEFWLFQAFVVLVFLVVVMIEGAAGLSRSKSLEFVAALVLIVPSLAVGCRRLHDTDRTGWWQLLLPIPFFGYIVLIILWCLRGTIGDNSYGPDPYAGQESANPEA